MLTAVMETKKPDTFITTRLKAMDMTIDRFSRMIGMSYSQTYDIAINGFKPGTRLGNIEKIADVLGVPVIELLDRHKRQN